MPERVMVFDANPDAAIKLIPPLKKVKFSVKALFI